MKRNPYNRANPQFSDRDLKHGGSAMAMKKAAKKPAKKKAAKKAKKGKKK
jgi:hypothetical protein